MININNVSKNFGEKMVLKNISFTVEEGEIFCLLGPSGAGKTTLIRLITGAISPDEGEIIINNIKVPNRNIIEKIGFMPQNEALYNDLSGRDNLLFFGGLFGLKGKDLEERTSAILNLVNLTEDAKKLVEKYSGGMKKRLSLAIALLHSPEILVLDEPTVGIDPLLRRTIWKEFNRLKSEGKSIIVTTHVMEEANMCDRAGLIYEGNLIAYGTIVELHNVTPNGSLEELFFIVKEEITNETIVY